MERLRVLHQTCTGMAFLHSFQPPILHRDLKSSNVLVDTGLRCKICDFGLSRSQGSSMTNTLGTVQWSSPEMLRQEDVTPASDVYSFGVLIWELLTHRVPYDEMNSLNVAVQVAYHGMRLPIPPNCPSKADELMQRCWEEDPAKRPSFSDILDQLQLFQACDLLLTNSSQEREKSTIDSNRSREILIQSPMQAAPAGLDVGEMSSPVG
ncbi:hypothetical protein CYMTET_34320 [Cymbomonas tetramitiformis]|uniref:Protein kinase domain-containing protein n=1 Tax=Cymbomonas tetramitiformis TaxID=36881 RepID=A0AAE0KQ24_9CHLO|nr:hypothetical protein CYMTET_34320 [Cymbomonas tetramitiformis]